MPVVTRCPRGGGGGVPGCSTPQQRPLATACPQATLIRPLPRSRHARRDAAVSAAQGRTNLLGRAGPTPANASAAAGADRAKDIPLRTEDLKSGQHGAKPAQEAGNVTSTTRLATRCGARVRGVLRRARPPRTLSARVRAHDATARADLALPAAGTPMPTRSADIQIKADGSAPRAPAKDPAAKPPPQAAKNGTQSATTSAKP